MIANLPPDILALHHALDKLERDTLALAANLTEAQGSWRAEEGSWSISECLDHLRVSNRQYLQAMNGPAQKARANHRNRTKPADPGWVGRSFLYLLQPPPKWWSKLPAPKTIRPSTAPLAATLSEYVATLSEAREFLVGNADLDLASIRFPNPFAKIVRFSLATGIHVIVTHGMRHLWQAERVRVALQADLGATES